MHVNLDALVGWKLGEASLTLTKAPFLHAKKELSVREDEGVGEHFVGCHSDVDLHLLRLVRPSLGGRSW